MDSNVVSSFEMSEHILVDASNHFGELVTSWLEGFSVIAQRVAHSSNPILLGLTDSNVADLYLATAHLIMASITAMYILSRWRRTNVAIPALFLIYFVVRAFSQLLEIIPKDDPAYSSFQLFDGITSVLAFFLSIMGFFMMRGFLKSPDRVELRQANEALKTEIKSRSLAEDKLSSTMNELEARVIERTAELEMANAALTAEIAERTATALALKSAKDRAEASNKSKNEFLANMSHEIRTPMTAIVGFSDMLTDRKITPAERITYIDSIRRNSDFLLKIIDDILDLAKIDAGSLGIDKVRVSILEIVDELKLMYENAASEKGLKLVFEAQTDVPAYIFSDPVRIRQVLINLIGNALKFTDKGEIKVGCRYSGQRLFFQISDTGCGINAANTKKIFSPFVQADSSITRRYGGTGLGLALSRRLSISLGGDLVLANSIVGIGSTFEFHCDTGAIDPMTMVKNIFATQIEQLTPFSESPASRVNLSNLTILLVEDSRDLQILTTRILTERGAKVTLAQNGREALESIKSQDADIILMDIQMPEMDGLTAAKKIREMGITKPMIAMTAYAMEGDRKRCLDAGFTDYMSKPIKKSYLINLIGEYKEAKQRAALKKPKKKLQEASVVETKKVGENGHLMADKSDFADDPIIGPVLNIFLESIPERIAVLDQAVQAASLEDIQKISHQLRGSAGAFGFSGITVAAAKLEDAVILKQNWESISSLADSLIQIASRTSGTPWQSSNLDSNIAKQKGDGPWLQ